MELRNFLDEDGRDFFDDWFSTLDVQAKAKVTSHLVRLKNGNLSSVKGVGEGVFERKIDWGPGYRIYFGRDGETLIILVAGGTKKSQAADIKAAHERWRRYKTIKRK